MVAAFEKASAKGQIWYTRDVQGPMELGKQQSTGLGNGGLINEVFNSFGTASQMVVKEPAPFTGSEIGFGAAVTPLLPLQVWDRHYFNAKGKVARVLIGHLEGLTFMDSRRDGRYFISLQRERSVHQTLGH